MIKGNKHFLFVATMYWFLSCSGKADEQQTHLQEQIYFKQEQLQKDTTFKRYGIVSGFLQSDVGPGNFRNLEHGFDSIAIRFWYVYANKPTQIVELINGRNGWEGHFYSIKRSIKPDGDTLVETLSHLVKKPGSGWKKLFQNVLKSNLLTMPSMHDMPGYDMPMDGDAIFIEIAAKYYYKLNYYSNPKSNVNIPGIKKLEELMTLIEKEFSEKRTRVI